MTLAPFTGNLGIKNAAHLLRRATFGANKATIDSFATMTASAAVLQLSILQTTEPLPPKDLKTGLSWLPAPVEDVNSEPNELSGMFRSWALAQFLESKVNILEKMVFLMHTFFPTIVSSVDDGTPMYYQNKLFRYYAVGNIKKLVKKICIDNAMLDQLDGRLNEVGVPNENFARELFELHTIGKGVQVGLDDYTNYTENDIKVAARILSGWAMDSKYGANTSNKNIDTDSLVPLGVLKGEGLYASRHDAAAVPERKFSAAFQNKIIAHPITEILNGRATKLSAQKQVDELVDLIFEQRATAMNYCKKIYRYFVYYNITPEIETNIITPLADTFIANNFEILPVVQELLLSQYFYDANNTVLDDNVHGGIIKSPLDLTLGTIRFFDSKIPDSTTPLMDYYDYYGQLSGFLENQGMTFYDPLDVAGYDAYHQNPAFNRNWITVNTLAFRYDFALKFSKNNIEKLPKINFATYIKANVPNANVASNIVKFFVDYLYSEAISTTGTGNRFDYFLAILTDIDWANEWNSYLNSNMSDFVNSKIEDLLAAMTQTPEYQLM